jgi:hypothetical protein
LTITVTVPSGAMRRNADGGKTIFLASCEPATVAMPSISPPPAAPVALMKSRRLSLTGANVAALASRCALAICSMNRIVVS